MTLFIVTLKFERHGQHDPSNKVTGDCMTSIECTDVTGNHHCIIVEAESIEEVKMITERHKETYIHITRIERAKIFTK